MRLRSFITAGLLSAGFLLAACGGGATGSPSAPASTPTPAPTLPPTPTPLANGLSVLGRVADAVAFRDALLASAQSALASDPHAVLNTLWKQQFPSINFYLPEYSTTSDSETVTYASGTEHGGAASADNPYAYAIAVADDSQHCAGGMLYGYPSLTQTKTLDAVTGTCDAVTALQQMGG